MFLVGVGGEGGVLSVGVQGLTVLGMNRSGTFLVPADDATEAKAICSRC